MDYLRNNTFFLLRNFVKVKCFNERNVGNSIIYTRKFTMGRDMQIFSYSLLNSSCWKTRLFFYRQNQHTCQRPKWLSNKKKLEVSEEYLSAALQKCCSVQEQLEVLYETTTLSLEDLQTRAEICNDVKNVLRSYFPNCVVHLVGSSANGFGLKGCDIDLTIELNCGLQEEDLCTEDLKNLSVEDVESGKVPLQTLHSLPSWFKLGFISRVLQNHSVFHDIALVSTRCPIIKFLYGQDELKCDLSLDNRNAIYSTKLLKLCGKLDERVLLLQTILSCWAKKAGLVGGVMNFKSYAFNLLLIYFLQTRNPPVLPTMEYLLTQCGLILNGDSICKINESADKFQSSRNAQSTEQLLREFFHFYLYFDFMQIISPLKGSCWNTSDIQNCDSLSKQFVVNTICLEDPLDVSWNVTCNVSYQNCKYFLKQFLMICKLYENRKCWHPGNGCWGIMQLFNQKNLKHSFRCDNAITFSIILKPETITALVGELSTSKTNVNLTNFCLKKSSQIVHDVLEDGFLFKCVALEKSEKESAIDIPQCDLAAHQVSENVSCTASKVHFDITSEKFIPKFQKVITNSFGDITLGAETNSNDSSVSTEIEKRNANSKKMYLRMQCTTNNTWQGREMYKQKYSLHRNVKTSLESERSISMKISQMIINRGVPEFIFNCECQESEVNGLPALLVRFSPVESASFPPKLARFLYVYMPKVVTSLI